MSVQMIRIEEKFNGIFSDKIDISDCIKMKADKKRNAFLSRAVAAVTVMIACDVDETIAATSITDGGNDKGIDAIYCDDNQKELVLVQSKWNKAGTKTIEKGDVLKFISGVEEIISLNFNDVNKKIKSHQTSIERAIRAMDYHIKIILSHTGNQSISRECKEEINKLLSKVNDSDNKLLTYAEMNQNDIYDYFSTGKQKDNIIIDDLLLYNWGVIEEPYKSYYGTINAAQVADWFSLHDKKLFNKNIRNYRGSTEVNEGIKKVLKENPTDFVYFNNGLKALCNSISRKAANSTNNKVGIFSIDGFSIVNGAQTTGCIGAAYKESPEKVSEASVFIQLIDLENAPQEYAKKITQLSNTQNRIDNKDFAALDATQERLSKELSFDNIEYLYKSGTSLLEPQKQITIDEAIIALACYHEDISLCVMAKSNFGSLVENIDKPPYKTLFNSKTSSFLLLNSVKVFRETEKILKITEIGKQGREHLALVHGNRLILHMVFHAMKMKIDFESSKIDDETLTKECRNACDRIIILHYKTMNELLSDAYPANIFKNLGRTRKIRDAMIAELA